MTIVIVNLHGFIYTNDTSETRWWMCQAASLPLRLGGSILRSGREDFGGPRVLWAWVHGGWRFSCLGITGAGFPNVAIFVSVQIPSPSQSAERNCSEALRQHFRHKFVAHSIVSLTRGAESFTTSFTTQLQELELRRSLGLALETTSITGCGCHVLPSNLVRDSQ